MVIKVSKMAAILVPLSDDVPSKSYSLTFPLMMKKKRSLSSLLSSQGKCNSESLSTCSLFSRLKLISIIFKFTISTSIILLRYTYLYMHNVRVL